MANPSARKTLRKFAGKTIFQLRKILRRSKRDLRHAEPRDGESDFSKHVRLEKARIAFDTLRLAADVWLGRTDQPPKRDARPKKTQRLQVNIQPASE